MLVLKCIKCKLVIKRGNIWLSNLHIPIIVTMDNIGIKNGKERFFQPGKLDIIPVSDHSATLSSDLTCMCILTKPHPHR